MPTIPFPEALNHGVLVFDGAMGTELYRHHVFTNRCFDELCLSDPPLIRRIHADYCDAGADVLTTNTFGANRFKLEHHSLTRNITEINARGVELARQALVPFQPKTEPESEEKPAKPQPKQ